MVHERAGVYVGDKRQSIACLQRTFINLQIQQGLELLMFPKSGVHTFYMYRKLFVYYSFVYPFVYLDIHTSIHTCMHMHACMHTYIHTYVRTYMHTYTHMCIYIYKRTYIHTHIHVCFYECKYSLR